MSKQEIYQAYISWLDNPSAAIPLEQFPNFPIACFDVFEDERRVVNRLVYFIPDFSGRIPRSFFFFEENTFSKDFDGDLNLIHSSFQLFDS